MKRTISEFKYDVFVNYSHRDSEWVNGWLVPRLEEAGLSVWIDVQELQLGGRLVDGLERAITQSRIILIVLTPGYLSSQWADFENTLVKALDPAKRQRRVIPLMLKPCELPLRLRTLTYIDFTQPDQIDSQHSRLLSGIATREEPARTVPSAGPTTQTVDHDLNAIRDLLAAAFSDEELTSLCFDYFPGAYEAFSAGMSKRNKIQMLIQYCERHVALGQLLAVIRKANPAQYSRFEHQQQASW